MRALAAASIGALVACAHPHVEIPTARPGRSVAIYMPTVVPDPELDAALATIRERIARDGGDPGPAPRAGDALGYVDDRRWIELAPGGELALGDLPADADLDSLVVEPLGEPIGAGALAILQCMRAPALAGALGDLGQARGLIGKAVVIGLAGGGIAKGTVRAVDAGGLWIDDGPRAVRVDGARVQRLRVAGTGTGDVRCKVRGAPGRHLVRVAYATGGVAWRAIHRIDVAIGADGAGTATVRTGFQIDAPGWTGDAEIALWRGLPGVGDPPERVWSGSAGLGAQVTVWSAPRQVPAHLAAVFRGALVTPGESVTDAYWRQQSISEVRTWLVLDTVVPEGTALAAVTSGDGPARMAQAPIERDGDSVRLPLWTDPELRGLRVKVYQSGDPEHTLHEHLAFTVGNLSDRAREVWIEEELRPARHHAVLHPHPRFEVRRGWLRVKLAVPAAGVAHASCDVAYDL